MATLLQIPSVDVKYVCDVDPNALGLALAKENGITCCSDPECKWIFNNSDVDLILEATGDPRVFEKLGRIRHKETSLIGARANRIMFTLLDTQNKDREEVERYKDFLEMRVANRTKELEEANRKLQEKVNE